MWCKVTYKNFYNSRKGNITFLNALVSIHKKDTDDR